MEKIKKILGQNISRLRKIRGYKSAAALAEDIDMSREAIANIERGAQWPSEETLDEIVKALDIQEENLFTDLNKIPFEDTLQRVLQDLQMIKGKKKN